MSNPPRLTTTKELDWIAATAKSCRKVIEVGVWVGHSLEVWASNIQPGGVVVGIDAWDLRYCGTEGMRDNLRKVGPNEAYLICQRRLKRFIQEGSVRLVRKPAIEAASQFARLEYDLVYLDAAVSFEEASKQIIAFEKSLRSGGTISGHHYLRRPGVRKAVDTRYAGRVLNDGQIWWVVL